MVAVVTVEEIDRIVLARCHGDLDLGVRDELVASLLPLPRGDVHTVVLDLSAVTFLDCAALSAVISLARECARHQARLILAAVPSICLRLLDLLELTEHFELAPTAEEAVALAGAWFELIGWPDAATSPFIPRPLAAPDTEQGRP